MTDRMGEPLVVAIDTATGRAIVALGSVDGAVLAADSWMAGHRHGTELLGRLEALLGSVSGGEPIRTALRHVAGVIVGIGPGAFTGLRVGIATAKALAVGLGVPLVGVSTGAALLAAAGEPDGALLLPAGPSDRTLVAGGRAEVLPAGEEAVVPDGTPLVAVDLPGRAPEDAQARGAVALEALPAALVRLGAARLARGEQDDPATLMPEYVTLPRGVDQPRGAVTLKAGAGG